MDDQTQSPTANETTPEVITVEETVQIKRADTDATVLLSLEEMIKNNISAIDKLNDELKKQRQMFADNFINDATYREQEEKAKEAAKIKNQTRQQILKQPAIATIAEKIKSVSQDLRERKAALSDYLLEYQRMTGATEIEDNDGQLRTIVNDAKLVKRSAKSE